MRLVDLVRNATTLDLTTEDGDPAPWELSPGLSDAELASFEASLPCALPAEVRELLQCCSGVTSGAVEVVDFTGLSLDFEYTAIFPHGVPVAADGFGNFWVVDLQPGARSWGPIYFVCHDPAVILLQSVGMAEFLTELVKVNVPPYASPIHEVREDALFEVWSKNPGVRSYEESTGCDDLDVRAFAAELDATFQIIDLRRAPVGFGFSWGRYGPNTVVKRHGALAIFAYQETVPWWRGLWRRLGGK